MKTIKFKSKYSFRNPNLTTWRFIKQTTFHLHNFSFFSTKSLLMRINKHFSTINNTQNSNSNGTANVLVNNFNIQMTENCSKVKFQINN